MLAKDIKVGGTYCAKVSGALTTVRVDAIRTGRGTKGNQTYYDVTNLRTGRKTTFRSAAKFRWAEPANTKRIGGSDRGEEEIDPFVQSAEGTGPALLDVEKTEPQEDESDPILYEETAPNGQRVKAATKPAKGEKRSDPFAQPAASGSASAPVASDIPSATVPASVEGEKRSDPTSASTVVRGGNAIVAPAGVASRLSSRLSSLTKGSGDNSPHVIVEARAGTGKTTTLIEGLKLLKGMESKLTPSPQQKAVWDAICLSKGKANSVCFVAFNKSIATELQERVPAGVEAMTMHSLGYRAVTKALGRQELSQFVVQDLTAELMGMDVLEAKRKKMAVLKGVEELVSLCKMNLTEGTVGDLDRLAVHYDVELEGNREEVYSLVPKVLERCKAPRGKICFDDMIWLPVIMGLPVTKYDLLLVDEAQDLNRCQQALAKMAGRRLILVGDPKQAIYGFAGADSDSMNRMKEELARAQGTADARVGCIVLPLTVTRRCGKAIVAEAQRLVPDFSAHESNPEGLVRTALRPTKKRMAVKPEDNYADQIGPGDFALCRINAPLVSECFQFIRQGRKANIQGRDIGVGLIKTVDKLSGKNDLLPVTSLVAALSDWLAAETAKEQAKRNPSESRLMGFQDRHDCLLCFTEGTSGRFNESDPSKESPMTAGDVKRKIQEVFTDEKTSPGIKLSSIHKAKGLEAKRVFILSADFGMRRDKMQAWELEQERNLEYVAITRAIEELVFVN